MNRTWIAGGAIAIALGPITAVAATPAEKCEAKKDKLAGSYFACRQKAEATSILKGIAADYAKCSDKFDDKWDSAEEAGDMACPDNVLTAPMNAFLAAQATQTALIVAGTNPIPSCGDGVVNAVGEQCDGSDLGGQTCSSLGQLLGSLACQVDCALDISDCLPTCPDGGFLYSGACWYRTALDENCDEVCAGVGLAYDSATLTIAGSGGTNAACDAILTGIGVGGAGVTDGSCFEGFGCLEEAGSRGRCTDPATSATVKDPTATRACACE